VPVSRGNRCRRLCGVAKVAAYFSPRIHTLLLAVRSSRQLDRRGRTNPRPMSRDSRRSPLSRLSLKTTHENQRAAFGLGPCHDARPQSSRAQPESVPHRFALRYSRYVRPASILPGLIARFFCGSWSTHGWAGQQSGRETPSDRRAKPDRNRNSPLPEAESPHGPRQVLDTEVVSTDWQVETACLFRR
jgi:hypothetical protein